MWRVIGEYMKSFNKHKLHTLVCCSERYMLFSREVQKENLTRCHVVTEIKFGYTLIFKGEALKGGTRKSTTIVGVRLNALLYTLAIKFTEGTPNLYLVRFCQ